MRSVLDELETRGFISQLTDDALRTHLRQSPATMYVGFDPTSDSLHLGHLLPIMAMAHFQRYGHGVLALVGGATGMIGDPSGKSEERRLLGPEDILRNCEGIKRQLSRFLAFDGSNPARLLDNNDWIGPIPFVKWLREVGKFFTVNYMLAKDSVKRRMLSEQGMSYTEFSYMTMQAYDFLHLYDEFGCIVQAGGNDQWGNITAGIDLVHKLRGAKVYGVTFPLIATASGEKIGKTASNAVWLDPCRTSPFQFYQYWIGTSDEDVERFLKLFTFLPLEEIDAVREIHRQDAGKRHGQRRLAQEVTRLVHGDAALVRAEMATRVLFGDEVSGLSDTELRDIFPDVSSVVLPRERLKTGIGLADIVIEAQILSSRSAVRRMVQQGGLYVNNRRVTDPDVVVGDTDLASASMLVIRVGKKGHTLVQFT